jgi:outer membrane protein
MQKFFLYSLIGAFFLSPFPALGQAADQKIATINILRAIIECSEGKQANESFQKKYEAKRNELAKKQKELADLQQQLNTQGTTMNDEARAELTQNIDHKTTELQRSQEDAEKEFTNLRNDIFNRIGTKISPIVQQYSREKNFTLLLDSSNPSGQLYYADPSLDITDEIIKRYDALQISQGGGGPTTPKKPVAQSQSTVHSTQPQKSQSTVGNPSTPSTK